MSFSLIGFGLLLLSFVAIAWFRGSRYRFALTVVVLLVMGGFYTFFSSNDDNAVNALILSRLEYDENDIIVGNNRTSRLFDSNYQSLMQSNDRYLGVHHQIRSDYDWTHNSSGYKKFIVHHGLVGFTIFILYIVSLFWFNRNGKAFVFLIMLITAFFMRDLLQSPMWMSMAIAGLYLLNNKDDVCC